MVSQHRCPGETPDNLDALRGVCIVAHHITQDMKLGTPIITGIGYHCLEGLKVAVNITENRAAHYFEE